MNTNPAPATPQPPAVQNARPSSPAPPPSTSSYQDHPLAEIFPLMPPDDLTALAANIRQHGLQTPVTLYEGKILDGRNRWRACQLVGLEPGTVQFPAHGDPLAFVLSANLHRRHLTTSQRALVAAKLATLPCGGVNKKPGLHSFLAPSTTQAAEKLSVGTAIVKKARKVLQDEALTRAVASGDMSVHAAVQEIHAAQAAQTVPLDDTNYEIPKALWPLWNRKAEVDSVLTDLSRLHQTLKTALKTGDLLFAPTYLPGVLTHLEGAHAAAQRSALYAVCPVCDGRNPEKCFTCQGRALVCKEEYDRYPAAHAKAVS